MKIPFSEKEMEVKSIIPARKGSHVPVYNSPLDSVELNKRTFLEKDAQWILIGSEFTSFTPAVLPDNIARGFVKEATPLPPGSVRRQGHVWPELKVHSCGRRLHERRLSVRRCQ